MQFWHIHVRGGQDVYYKSIVKISPVNVAQNAVIDGEMEESFICLVTKIEEISSEKYYERMSD
jgi:hypothetical protein